MKAETKLFVVVGSDGEIFGIFTSEERAINRCTKLNQAGLKTVVRDGLFEG